MNTKAAGSTPPRCIGKEFPKKRSGPTAHEPAGRFRIGEGCPQFVLIPFRRRLVVASCAQARPRSIDRQQNGRKDSAPKRATPRFFSPQRQSKTKLQAGDRDRSAVAARLPCQTVTSIAKARSPKMSIAEFIAVAALLFVLTGGSLAWVRFIRQQDQERRQREARLKERREREESS